MLGKGGLPGRYDVESASEEERSISGSDAGVGEPPADGYAEHASSVTMMACFNHKGGVAKTSTAFEIGWSLAAKGLRVLMVDADPQCSLTQLALQRRLDMAGQRWDSFLATRPQPHKLGDALHHFEDGLVVPDTVLLAKFEAAVLDDGDPAVAAAAAAAAEPVRDRCGELRLLMGDENLVSFEELLGQASSQMHQRVRSARELPGSVYHLTLMTAHHHQSDVVIFDMSPSLGRFNCTVLACCNFFLVPCLADYFSFRAVQMLESKLYKQHEDDDGDAAEDGEGRGEWSGIIRDAEVLRSLQRTSCREVGRPAPPAVRYMMPLPRPVFLGTVITRFNQRGGAAPAALQAYISDVKRAARALYETLRAAPPEMALVPPADAFTPLGMSLDNLVLMQMPDFTSLVAYAQFLGVPAPFLDLDQVKRLGSWSKRAARFYNWRQEDRWFKPQSGFEQRIESYRLETLRAVDRVLTLMTASFEHDDARTLLRNRLTAAVAADPVAADEMPGVAEGDFRVNPFQVFLDDDQSEERAWKEAGAGTFAGAVAVGYLSPADDPANPDVVVAAAAAGEARPEVDDGEDEPEEDDNLDDDPDDESRDGDREPGGAGGGASSSATADDTGADAPRGSRGRGRAVSRSAGVKRSRVSGSRT